MFSSHRQNCKKATLRARAAKEKTGSISFRDEYLNIKEYKPDELIAAEYNPRQLTKDQHKDLTDSIKRFGLVDPLIVNTHKDRMNILVGGHQRLKIAQELNIKTIPCVQVKLTPDKERELNIRLNRNTGEWDYDSLANYFDVGELTEWGFDESQLTGFTDLDYSILDDEEVDNKMEGMLDGTRKAIQIEFTLEDYEQAYKLINELRKDEEYVGGLILAWLNDYKTKNS